MAKFKQMQIDFDDEWTLNEKGESIYGDPIDPSYYGDEPLDKSITKTNSRCSHKVKLTIGKKVLVTYCEKCGKILNQANKKSSW